MLLEGALFTFLEERLNIHARDLRAGGANEDTVAGGVERYRGQLLEQFVEDGDQERARMVRGR